MPDKEHHDIEELRQIAKWFYKGDGVKKRLSIAEIARRRGINKRTVEKRLDRAVKEGIVRIEIPETVTSDYAEELKQRFRHLQRIIPVPTVDPYYPDLLEKLGVQAANYFDDVTARGEHHVGVTGGCVVLQFCEALGRKVRENIHIYTLALIGRGLDKTGYHIDPLVCASILWSKCGNLIDHCHYATVPPCDRLEREAITAELDSLSRRQPIRDAIERMNNITMAIGSIGLIPRDKHKDIDKEDMMMDLLDHPTIEQQLVAEGAFGDFAYCAFDDMGAGNDLWRYFLTAGDIDPDPNRRGIGFYKQMVEHGKIVMVIAAGGACKEKQIYAALKAGIFNVWITDYDTLERVHECMVGDEDRPKQARRVKSAHS